MSHTSRSRKGPHFSTNKEIRNNSLAPTPSDQMVNTVAKGEVQQEPMEVESDVSVQQTQSESQLQSSHQNDVEKTYRIDNMPDVVLARIFLHAAQRDRMFSFPKVCRRWRNVVDGTVWQNFRFPLMYCIEQNQGKLDRIEQWLVKHARYMRNVCFAHIGIGSVTDKQMQLYRALIENTSSLVELTIEVSWAEGLSTWLNILAKSPSSIRKLRLSCLLTSQDANFNTAVLAIESFGSNLEELEVQYAGTLSSEFLERVLPSLTGLTSLKLDSIRDLKLGSGLSSLKNLRVLEATSCVISSFHELSQLESARFNHSLFLQNRCIYNVLSCKSLKSLSLAFCNLQSFYIWHFPAPLEFLNISSCSLRSVPPNFFLFSELRVLDLSRNMLQIFPREILKLEHLRSVNLSWQYGICSAESFMWGINVPSRLKVQVDWFKSQVCPIRSSLSLDQEKSTAESPVCQQEGEGAEELQTKDSQGEMVQPTM
eukprot:TRINITY_DN35580_c0_g1_i1.p1 TRINITY_DN35580_c0_g1~~TRINITY_DN35580_c0_g1_i1.p1  ORF type:complete len:482 (-),score=32.35 TRINITY_DN35580_c0_g1_i1:335-1780(-)